jgi:hypothetical protein
VQSELEPCLAVVTPNAKRHVRPSSDLSRKDHRKIIKQKFSSATPVTISLSVAEGIHFTSADRDIK